MTLEGRGISTRLRKTGRKFCSHEPEWKTSRTMGHWVEHTKSLRSQWGIISSRSSIAVILPNKYETQDLKGLNYFQVAVSQIKKKKKAQEHLDESKNNLAFN